MRVLVTGHCGFIGSHLVPELEVHGHEVHGADLNTGIEGGEREWRMDLSEPGSARYVFERVQPDVVVHLAAQVGREFGEDDMLHTIDSNAAMTCLVAAATAEAGARLVYTSTSEVYGDQAHAVCDEDMGPFSLPHNLYGLTKKWGEEVAALYAPDGLTIVRPSMPYGPGAPPGRGRRAMDNMLWQAHHRMEIPVHRGAARSWCHISDTVRGWRLIIEQGAGRAFNLGRDDRELSMEALAHAACDLADAPHDLVNVIPAPARQTVVKRLSTTALRNLGWEPEVELRDGLPEVYGWVRQFDAEGNRA